MLMWSVMAIKVPGPKPIPPAALVTTTPSHPRAFITLPISELPGAEELKVDDKVYLQNMYGQPFPARVAALTDTEITFDANHEMAGKELNFRIELVEVL